MHVRLSISIYKHTKMQGQSHDHSDIKGNLTKSSYKTTYNHHFKTHAFQLDIKLNYKDIT